MGLLAPLVNVVGSAGAPFVGSSLLAAGGQLMGGILQNQANARQAARQMEFQRDMSSTAHFREVQDLKAAGLNPILSGTGGMGAATGAGAAAQMVDPVGNAVGSALAARKQDGELKLMDAQVVATDQSAATAQSQEQLNEAQKSRAEAETRNLGASEALIKQQAKTEKHRTESERMNSIINRHESVVRGSSAAAAAREAQIDKSTAGGVLGWINRGVRAMKGGSARGQ